MPQVCCLITYFVNIYANLHNLYKFNICHYYFQGTFKLFITTFHHDFSSRLFITTFYHYFLSLLLIIASCYCPSICIVHRNLTTSALIITKLTGPVMKPATPYARIPTNIIASMANGDIPSLSPIHLDSIISLTK